MNTPIRFLLGALALVAPAALILWAAEGPAPVGKGKVLLLDNERMLEGDIEKVGEQYRVRRTVGETWVPAGKVLHLGQTHEEAFAYLRARANLRDPDERLRLARWCQLQGLREQALAEVKAAAQLRPEHAPTQRLLAGLERATACPPSSPPASPVEKPEPAPAAAVDVTQDSLGQFVTRVQPILLNACAGCHTSDRGGAFKLIRPHANEITGRKTLQQNLTAVLAQVNLDQPGASPLLAKAVSVHGQMENPPLRGRQAAAFRTLEEWVQRTAADNAHLRTTSAAAPAKVAPEAPAAHPAAEPPENPPPPSEVAPHAEKMPPPPADPFDPAIFNRQAHPERK